MNVPTKPSGAPLHSWLLLKRDGVFYLVLWLNAPSYVFEDLGTNHCGDNLNDPATAELTLPDSTGETRIYWPSVSGLPLDARPVRGSTTVMVGDEAMVLELSPRKP